MPVQIEGCVALVTGGNRGIGLGFVRQLVRRGARRAYLGARNPANAEAIVAEAPEIISAIELDVVRPDLVKRAAESCPDVTLLINNAGAFSMHTLLEAPDLAACREEMEVNYFGMLAMVRAFAPVLKCNGGGAIGNVLSAGAIRALPEMGGYGPSKFAARAAGNCLRAELEQQGTTLTNLIVGSVDTRMAAHIVGVKSTPDDVAASSLDAIELGIEEHDTDPGAVAARAWLARDPAGLARMMANRLHSRAR
jgi:NAD(P)-dependent dehydrogenase (short-subunit alcohol dehydrogenase family)